MKKHPTILLLNRPIVFFFAFVLALSACEHNNKPNEFEFESGKMTGIPAIDAITKDIQQDPENMALYVARCEAYSAEGLFEEAELDARLIWEKDKTNWKSARLLAWAYFDNNKSKPAIKTIEKALEIHPDTLHLLLLHAELNLIVKQYDEALVSIDKALKLDKFEVEAFFMKGLIQKYMGDTINAVNNFQTAVELDADHFDSYVQLAQIFSTKGEKIALQYFENALRIDSTSFDALMGLASFYQQQYNSENGMLEKAIKAYEKLILMHPSEESSYYNFALLYLEENKLEEALKYFDIATKYDPTFAEAYYYMAYIYEKQGDVNKAITYYRNAMNNGDRASRAEKALQRLGALQ